MLKRQKEMQRVFLFFPWKPLLRMCPDRQLHSASKDAGGRVHPLPITQEDQHFLHIPLQIWTCPILKNNNNNNSSIYPSWGNPTSFLSTKYPGWIRNTKNSICGWHGHCRLLQVFGVATAINLHSLPLAETNPLSRSYWTFLLSLKCLFSAGL